MDILSFMLGKQSGGSSTTVEELSVTENGTYTADTGKAYSPVTVTVPQTTVESLSVTENGTYTAPSGKAYSPVTVKITGPFLQLPQSATTPTADDVRSNGVSLGSGDTNIYLSNDREVYYFRVSNSLVFACRESGANVYSLFGNGNLRTSPAVSQDLTTGLYYSEFSNVSPNTGIYNCSSRDDGLSRLAMFI